MFDSVNNTIIWIIHILVLIFIITTIVVFIIDGIHSKKEGRKRNTKIKALFIVGMVFAGVFGTIYTLAIILGMLIFRGM